MREIRLSENTLIFILLLIYVFLRCYYLDVIPKFDAGTYWEGLKNAVINTKSIAQWGDLPSVIIENYNYLGHTSMGYYAILVLFQLIDFPNLLLLNLTNILLAAISIFSVFKIFRFFLSSKQQLTEVILSTFVFALEPLFIGSSISFNTDFPVLVFYTIALACLLYDYYLYFALACLFMIFSKETGVIFWFGLVVGSILFRPFKLSTNLKRVFCLFFPGVAILLYTIMRKGKLWGPHQGVIFDSNGWNCFGFNSNVIFYRFGEIFVLDFHWILVSLILLSLVVVLLKTTKIKKIIPENQNQNLIRGILLVLPSFLLFVVFNLTYITYVIPRYVVHSGFFLVFLSVLLLPLVLSSFRKRIAILSMILFLFLVQSMRYVDPISKKYFGTIAFGSHEILFIDTPGESVGNAFAYNTEFTIIDKLFNLMHAQIPIQPDSVVIAWNSNDYLAWISRDGLYVDIKTLKRTINWRNAFRYKVIDIQNLPIDSMPENAVYVYMPWLANFSNEESELNILRRFYSIPPPSQVDINGYYLRFYRLTQLKK